MTAKELIREMLRAYFSKHADQITRHAENEEPTKAAHARGEFDMVVFAVMIALNLGPEGAEIYAVEIIEEMRLAAIREG